MPITIFPEQQGDTGHFLRIDLRPSGHPNKDQKRNYKAIQNSVTHLMLFYRDLPWKLQYLSALF